MTGTPLDQVCAVGIMMHTTSKNRTTAATLQGERVTFKVIDPPLGLECRAGVARDPPLGSLKGRIQHVHRFEKGLPRIKLCDHA